MYLKLVVLALTMTWCWANPTNLHKHRSKLTPDRKNPDLDEKLDPTTDISIKDYPALEDPQVEDVNDIINPSFSWEDADDEEIPLTTTEKTTKKIDTTTTTEDIPEDSFDSNSLVIVPTPGVVTEKRTKKIETTTTAADVSEDPFEYEVTEIATTPVAVEKKTTQNIETTSTAEVTKITAKNVPVHSPTPKPLFKINPEFIRQTKDFFSNLPKKVCNFVGYCKEEDRQSLEQVEQKAEVLNEILEVVPIQDRGNEPMRHVELKDNEVPDSEDVETPESVENAGSTSMHGEIKANADLSSSSHKPLFKLNPGVKEEFNDFVSKIAQKITEIFD